MRRKGCDRLKSLMKILFLPLLLGLLSSFAGCTATEEVSSEEEYSTETLDNVVSADTSSLPDLAELSTEGAVRYSFSDGGISAEGEQDGEISGTELKIQSPGTYILTGTCADGSVTVTRDLTGVYLVLDGLHLTSSQGPALTVNKSTSCCVYLAQGSENYLADPSTEHAEGAALKFKSGAALLLAGEGTLTVTGNYKNGIKGGAGSVFRMVSGKITVTAANNALACDHSLEIQGGSLDLTAKNDGIKASPDEGDTLSVGNILLSGGTVKIHAEGDGISAYGYLELSGGTWDITTTGEIATSTGNNFGGGKGPGMRPGRGSSSTETATAADDTSSKGIKSGLMKISGGNLTVSSTDHALHCNGQTVIEGGTLVLASSRAKGIATHGDLTFSGNTTNVRITNATEGIESKGGVTVNGGMIRVEYASDDGINLGGTVSSSTAEQHTLTVNGGYLYCYAAGDSVDSNGRLVMNGGTVIAIGPANGGNSCLDIQYVSQFNGGTVLGIAASSSMWNEVVGHLGDSAIYNLSAGVADGDTRVAVFSEDGLELISVDCPLQGNVGVFFLSNQVEDLSTCTFKVGEVEASPSTDGGMGGYFPGGGDHGGGPGGGRPGMPPGRW